MLQLSFPPLQSILTSTSLSTPFFLKSNNQAILPLGCTYRFARLGQLRSDAPTVQKPSISSRTHHRWSDRGLPVFPEIIVYTLSIIVQGSIHAFYNLPLILGGPANGRTDRSTQLDWGFSRSHSMAISHGVFRNL